jgi:L-cystine transport system substrate-binding protein
MKTKKLLLLATALFAAILLFSCPEKKTGTGAEAGRETKIIRAVTENAYPPYSYVDDNGNLTGYDVEVVRAIGEKLKGSGYDLQVEGIDGEAALFALQSHTADIFFDEMAITAERETRYHFSIPYYVVSSNIIVHKDRNDIKTIQDLEGKVLGQFPGDSWDQFLMEYNEKTAVTPIKLEPRPATIEQTLLSLQNGLFDAIIDNPITANEVITRTSLDLQIIPEPVLGENIGLMFQRDDDGLKLKNLIDPVIRELENDGTLTSLSLQFTGYPYNPGDYK